MKFVNFYNDQLNSRVRVAIFVGWLLSSSVLVAHPVSFRDSVGIMGYHAPQISHNQLNYSLRHWAALGIHHIRRPNLGEDRHATLASANLLLKRWNGEALQANLYAVIGLGSSELSGDSKFAGMGLLQFDIEDRNYYFLAKHIQMFNKDRSDFRQSTVRLGLAPYQDLYDGIHSWLILEWQGLDFSQSNFSGQLTPLLRVFYRNLLFEIGQSFSGETKFNYIVHF